MFKKIISIFLIFILSFTFVNAKSVDFSINEVEIVEKSGAIVAVDPSFASNEITTDSTLKEKDDYVIYAVTLKNNESEKYKLVKIEDNNTNEYIDVSYDSDKEIIESGDTITVNVKIKYSKLLKNVESKDLSDFNVILVLEDENGNNSEIIVNPKTSDNILCYVVLFGISVIGIILLIKRYKGGALLLVLPIIISPLIILGKSEYKVNITFKDMTVIGEFEVYEVIIDSGNGTTETRNIKYGDKVGSLETPTKEGYDFVGWVDEDGNPVNGDTVITSETNIRAQYDAIHYSITYNLDDGVAVNVESYTIEDEITLNNPIKPGYSFSGWTEGDDPTLRTSVTINVGSMGNKVFTAHFSAREDTVYHVIHMKMKMNGEYEEALDEELHGTTDTFVTPQLKDYEGFKQPAEQNVKIEGDGSTKVYYYYERNKYQFTVNNREYVNCETEDGKYYYGTEIVISAKNKQGYTFSKWSNDDTNASTTITLSGDLTIEPIYTPNSNTPYKVFHRIMKVDGQTYELYDEINGEGTTDTPVTPPVKTIVGFKTPNTQTVNINADGSTEVEYLYEREKYQFTVNNREYVNTEFEDGKYYYQTVISATAKDRAGYTFDGWLSGETTKTISFSITSDTTIEPVYTARNDTHYTVNHMAMKLDGETYELIEGYTGTGITDTSVTPPVKHMDGFTTPEEQTINIDGSGNAFVTYYYDRISYTLTINGSEYVETATPSGSYLYGKSITLTAKNRVGYTFDKWSNNSTDNPITFNMSGNITIEPIYSPIEYTITFNSMGGNAVESITRNYNQPIGTLSTPEKENYVFDGWYTSDTGGEKITETTLVTGTTTYYAHWLNSVALATVTPTSITINKNKKANITVTNVGEEYSFTTSNENVATVNNSGVVTGIDEGNAIITITGKTSGKTKTVSVTVVTGTHTVTFDSRGGSSVEDMEVEDNTSIGSLPTTEKDNFEFIGWYTSAEGGTKITSSTKITEDVTYYAHWNQTELDLTKVFYIPGSCTFNGNITVSEIGNITSDSPQGCISTINPSGNDIDYTDVKYIDSQIALFSSDNFEKDFELGFTLNEFVRDDTVDKQASIVNSKLENSTEKYPGFVIRRNTNKFELTERFGTDTTYSNQFVYTSGMKIRVSRQDGVIFYSVNDGEWIDLQNIRSYAKRFNLNTWFGAMSKETSMTSTGEGSTAGRYFKGKISDVYIKLETGNVTKHTVTFDANGGTAMFTTKQVKDGNKIYGLPSVTKTNMELDGWYTDDTYTTRVTEDTIINGDVTFVAKWKGLNVVARVGDNEFSSLQDAIDSVPDDETKTVVTLLEDLNLNETVTIHSGNNIEFDLQNHTLTSTNVAILTNYGTITIKNGTLINNGVEPFYSIDNKDDGIVYITGGTLKATKANAIGNTGRVEITGGSIIGEGTAAAINNNEGGVLIISGGSVVTSNTNKAQAIYNNGGTTTITGDAYLESNSSNRGAVHNNLGTVNILGGTIISKNYSAVVNNDTMIIGDDSDPIDITTPVLQGKTYGLEINSGKTVTVYDGVFKGITSGINNTSRVTHNTNVDFNTTNTETIGSNTYNIAYLEEQ